MTRFWLSLGISVWLGGLLLAAPAAPAAESRPWAPERAWAWYAAQPWLIGCNFLPSTAVNDVDMWQKETFDAKTIDRELGWARQLGFNTVRVFVNFVVWEDDPAGFKDTFRRFLKIANKHGMTTLVILLDDCFKPEPRVGLQEAPEPGVHNSQWVQSPGERRRTDRTAWPQLELYVKDMVGTFGQDPRVLAWELYNEPSQSLPLVESAFRWAREAAPTQPVTTTLFGNEEMQRRILALSDVLCFHDYGPLPGVKAQVERLLAHGRPVLCTEWMARGAGSRFETHLPYLKDNRIAAWNWGLVAGRTQTYFPWGSPKDAPEPKLWHHDIFRPTGVPFSTREIQAIQTVTGRQPTRGAARAPTPHSLVPTAERAPVAWRYTLAKPDAHWFQPGFDDVNWFHGSAPFGREEAPIARQPRTVWTSSDIWLRRTLTLPAGPFKDLAFSLHHDEDTEVYLNGVLALQASGYNAAYESCELTPEAQAALRPGTNVLAVHVHQTIGGQYFDLGLEGTDKQGAAGRAALVDSAYRGWNSLALRNGLIEVQVVPSLGGRIVQFKLGGHEFLWVNPQLAGHPASATGLAPDGGWLNYGGDKLWPAPQGWDNDQQWPGPPDAVLDGQPYQSERLSSPPGRAALRLTSRDDPRSGIRFSRVMRVMDGSTRVRFAATMKNIDTKPRRWGIWAHTQLEGAQADGTAHNSLLRAWCPMNPRSHFPQGYDVIFGAKDNASFQPDPSRGLMQVPYRYEVGKIGLDSPAGWVATVDGGSGAVFVQRFVFEPHQPYPDGSSVEFWLNGVGQIHAFHQDITMTADPVKNPYVFESEVLSPCAELRPGQSYTWRYEWCACHIGGDDPVVACTEAGVVAEPLVVRRAGGMLRLHGRFGVFAPGQLEVAVSDGRGHLVTRQILAMPVSPLQAAVVDAMIPAPASAQAIALRFIDVKGRLGGRLAHAAIQQQ